MEKPNKVEIVTAIVSSSDIIGEDCLCFDQGDLIQVLQKQGDWWYGLKVFGKKTGWFQSASVCAMGGKVEITANELSDVLKPKMIEPTKKLNETIKPPIPPKPKIVNNHSHLKKSQQDNLNIQNSKTKSCFKTKLDMIFRKSSLHKSNDKSESRVNITKCNENEVNLKHQMVVVAIADYQSKDFNQLCFRTGDFIRINQFTNTGWWQGELIKNEKEDEEEENAQKHIGWFPESYVQIPENDKKQDNNSESKQYWSDDSFESDDSDYESGSSNWPVVNRSQLDDDDDETDEISNNRPINVNSTIAILSLNKIEAIQLYPRNLPLDVYLKIGIGRSWNCSHTLRTTTTSSMERIENFSSQTIENHFKLDWNIDLRLNILNMDDCLMISCLNVMSDQCLAMAEPIRLDTLISHSKHLNNFTKGIPLTIHSNDIEWSHPDGHQIKACLLVKFDIVDLR
ncbi:hypothetical protein RDWZM_003657 [Blomia tropicalis]|uniref:SH3 domain-containing protein n=1 Tax=Blomia tropicalis TaxID=40697 RepID=A0A9Q0MG84_BLOTA|nr:hypothetical protein RDWZM_003657 [Blomia tropicalis]